MTGGTTQESRAAVRRTTPPLTPLLRALIVEDTMKGRVADGETGEIGREGWVRRIVELTRAGRGAIEDTVDGSDQTHGSGVGGGDRNPGAQLVENKVPRVSNCPVTDLPRVEVLVALARNDPEEAQKVRVEDSERRNDQGYKAETEVAVGLAMLALFCNVASGQGLWLPAAY